MTDATGSIEGANRSRTFAALAIPDFRKFYLGHGISLIGTWLQAAAVGWIVFDKTHSERLSGLIEAAGIMPGLAVGLFAGALADRVVPRTLILLSQVAQMLLAFALAILVGLGIERVWHLAVIVAATRIFVTFEMPARQVFLYSLVGRKLMMNAIALNSGLFNASRVLGPALAGECLARFGETGCFAFNGASYLAAIAALLMIRVRPPARSSTEGKQDRLLGGFTYLWKDRRVLTLYLVMTAFGILGAGFTALGPSYAQRVIGTGSRGFSLLLAAGGVGATLGALLVASLGGIKSRESLIVAGMTIFAIAIAGTGLLPARLGVFGGPIRLILGSLGLFGTGFGLIVFYAAAQTVIQAAVPDELRGRIMGIWMIVYSGSVPIGSIWSGELAQAVGPSRVMVLSAVLCGLLAFGVWSSGVLVETPVTPRREAP